MGDKAFTTDQIEMIEGKDKDYVLPVTYEKNKAPDNKWSEKKLYDTDYLSFGSKIGFVTNCSTYWYALRADYAKDSEQYKELTRRLIWSRFQQGSQIDKTKGVICDQSPSKWVRESKDSTPLDRELVVRRKPYFQKYIYPKLNQEYKEWKSKAQRYSYAYYGKNIQENDDKSFLKECDDNCPVIDNGSTMNRICHYMESHIKELRASNHKQDQFLLDAIMMDDDRELKLEYTEYMQKSLRRYKELKSNLRDNTKYVSREEKQKEREQFYIYCELLRDEIIKKVGSSVDAANLAVYVGYENNSQENREFVWDLFGKEIFENVKKNRQKDIYVPELNPNGDIEYLGLKYSRKKVIPDDKE